jgi:hypothetical protein
MTNLILNDVTLVSIDGTGNNDYTLKALHHSKKHITFGKTIFLSPTETYENLGDVELINISPMTYEGWSKFVLKSLGNYITTKHYLYVDYDGFVLHPDAWRDEFLEYDYIGAPFFYPDHVMSEHVDQAVKDKPVDQLNLVGNGGFTLRSRKFLEAAATCEDTRYHLEDVYSCFNNYEHFCSQGVKFAPINVASKFSYNYLHNDKSIFGFHGDKNHIKEV